MLSMIKQQGSQVYPAFTKELLAGKTDEDLVHRMEKVFKNLCTAYLKKDRSGDLDSDVNKDEDNKEIQKQCNRCWQRKSRVC
jgi:hypothetical protein